MKPRILLLILLVVGVLYWRESRPECTAPVGSAPIITDSTTIVVYTASWCGKCQEDKPYIARLAAHYRIVTIDAGEMGIPIPRYDVYFAGDPFGSPSYSTNNIHEIE